MFAASPLASQVPADDSARVDTVRKLFVVGRMEEFHAQMLQMALDRYAQVPALAPYAEPMREFFKKHGSFAAIEADMILPELMRELGHPKPPGQQPGSGT